MARRKISVCLAAYNGEEYIHTQLKSILTQLEPQDEVIISDDCSGDKTLDVIASLNDSRIKVLTGQRFASILWNIQNALKEAKGDIIFLSDQDDIWMENKVAVCMKALESYDLVVSDCQVVNNKLEVIHPSLFQLNNSKSGLLHNLLKNSYIGCCMAFNRNVLNLAVPFPQKVPLHDIWIGFVAECFFKVKFIDEKLIMYRRHGKNESSTAEKSRYSFAEKLGFRWNTLKYLPGLLLKRVAQKKVL